MVDLGLWPASIETPQLGFTFELMDHLKRFTLDAACSLKDFCKILSNMYKQGQLDIYHQLRRTWYYVSTISVDKRCMLSAFEP